MHTSEKIFYHGVCEVHSEQEMRELGRRMADLLEPGDVLGLVGELGAGKTRLVQGILGGLGCSLPATSPTFGLVHEHTDGRLSVAHFDFYRLQHPEEVLQIGWDDYLRSDYVLLVEWADRFDGRLMPTDTVWLRLESCAEHSRRVTEIAAGAWEKKGQNKGETCGH